MDIKRNFRISDDVINQIKENLMSRNMEKQTEAVQYLHHTFKDVYNESEKYEELCKVLLISDISTFLCESMATLSLPLLKLIISCLNHLSNNEIFYTENYAIMVIQTTVRCVIVFANQDNKDECILEDASKLLTKIFDNDFECHELNKLSKNPLNPDQLMEMILSVLREKHIPKILVGNFCVLLKYILKLNVCINVDIEVLNNVFELVMNSLKEDRNITDITEICNSMLNIIKFIIREESMKDPDVTGTDTINESNKVIMTNIFNIIYDTCVPYYMSLKANQFVEVYDEFVMLLNNFYFNEINKVYTGRLSKLVTQLGILDLLQFIIYTNKYTTNLSKDSLICIYEIITSLAENDLMISGWTGGSCAFKQHVFEGLMDLPKDSSKWIYVFVRHDTTETAFNSIIIFLYYQILNSNNQTCYRNLINYLWEYVRSLPSSFKIPRQIIKPLWFIVSRSSLLDVQPLFVVKISNYLSKYIIEEGENIIDLYTHDPALIFWACFSTNIGFYNQVKLFEIWISKELCPRDSIVFDLIHCTPVACVCLLEVVTSGPSNIVLKAAELLCDALEDADAELRNIIAKELWDKLPGFFAKVENSDSNVFTNIVTSIYLACEWKPLYINYDIVIQMATDLSLLLASYLVKPSEKCGNAGLFAALTKLAALFLDQSVELKSPKILDLYINNELFMIFIHMESLSVFTDLSLAANRLMINIQEYQNCFKVSNAAEILLDPEDLRIDTKMDEHLVIANVELLKIALDTENNLQIIKVDWNNSSKPSSELAEEVMHSLQNMYYEPVHCENALSCMAAFYKYASKDKALVSSIANHPFVYLVLNNILNCSPPLLNKTTLSYINSWLACVEINNTLENNQPFLPVMMHKFFEHIFSNFLKTFVVMFMNSFCLEKLDNSCRLLMLEIGTKIINNKDKLPVDFVFELEGFFDKHKYLFDSFITI